MTVLAERCHYKAVVCSTGEVIEISCGVISGDHSDYDCVSYCG